MLFTVTWVFSVSEGQAVAKLLIVRGHVVRILYALATSRVAMPKGTFVHRDWLKPHLLYCFFYEQCLPITTFEGPL